MSDVPFCSAGVNVCCAVAGPCDLGAKESCLCCRHLPTLALSKPTIHVCGGGDKVNAKIIVGKMP